jgi:hypothetical protein
MTREDEIDFALYEIRSLRNAIRDGYDKMIAEDRYATNSLKSVRIEYSRVFVKINEQIERLEALRDDPLPQQPSLDDASRTPPLPPQVAWPQVQPRRLHLEIDQGV